MLRSSLAVLPLAFALAASFLTAACSGQVQPGTSGGGGGGGTSSGSSSGSTTCNDLPVPSIAELCPDGSYASPAYVLENGQCTLVTGCSYDGGASGSSSGVSPTPVPSPPVPWPPAPSPPPAPTCTATEPNACSACLALPQICEVCSNGEAECAHYVIESGACAVEICPPSTIPIPSPPPVPPVSTCSPGMPCNAGEGCGSGGAPGSGDCTTSCTCGESGYFECTQSCPPSPAIDAGVGDGGPGFPGCSQGDSCTPNSGCGGGSGQGCDISCECDGTGHLQCSEICPG